MTEWRAIPEWPAYEVSICGRVRRVAVGQNGRKPHELRCSLLKSTGYMRVRLHDLPRVWNVDVHRLVAIAFLGPRPSSTHCVAHNDGSRTNNHAQNLRWALPAENSADMAAHGTKPEGEAHGMCKLTASGVTEMRRRYAAGEKQRDLAAAFGVHQAQVHRIVCRKTWKHLPEVAA
jgi:hypothetical protein